LENKAAIGNAETRSGETRFHVPSDELYPRQNASRRILNMTSDRAGGLGEELCAETSAKTDERDDWEAVISRDRGAVQGIANDSSSFIRLTATPGAFGLVLENACRWGLLS
jgi:hypothetical protein